MSVNYWNIADNVVDASKVLAEDKPVAKAIIGGIDSIVESKANGVSNSDIMTVLKAQAKSKWNSIDSKKLNEISGIIGGDIKLDLKTDVTKKDTGWLGKLWKYLAIVLGFVKPMITNPDIAKVVGYAEVIVKAKDTGISNNAIKDTLVSMSKSAWNSLDSDKINKIMEVINKK